MYFSKKINGKRIRNPLYGVWLGMKERCNNPNHNSYKRYGGRGIVICDEWDNSSIAFMEWAEANGYIKGLQLDRINNNEGYSPGNCRFVTRTENMRNMRCTKFYSYRGETKSLGEWAEVLKLNYDFLLRRIKLGWCFEKTIETPIRYKRKNTFYERENTKRIN